MNAIALLKPDQTARLLLVLVGSLSILAAPVAVVVDLQGKAEISPPSKRGNELQLFDKLQAGDHISLKAGAMLVLAHREAKTEYTLAGPAEVDVQPTGIGQKAGASAAARKLADITTNALTLDQTRQGMVRMRFSPSGSPTTGDVVFSGKLSFDWPLESEEAGLVLVLAQRGSSNVQRFNVQAPPWELPGTVKLAAGATYDWRIESKDGSKTLFSSHFAVMPSADQTALQTMRPASNAPFASRALYAKTLDGLGAKGEAKLIYQQLLKERPNDPALNELGEAE